MLHATFCPFVVSSMPLTRSGAVSKRTRISAEKVSLSAFCMAARCSAGTSKALRTTAGSEADLSASPRPCFALRSEADFSREGFVERILYGRALFRGHVKGAAHHRGVGG